MFISRRKTIQTLKNSGIVVIKTDTIFGLSCSINSDSGLKTIFNIKKRDPNKPLIILFDSFETLHTLIQEPTEPQLNIIHKHWPGPLTLILKLRSNVSLNPLVSSMKSTIAARIPKNEDLRSIIRETGPIVSTSINSSNQQSLLDPSEIQDFVGHEIKLYRNNTEIETGTNSTIFCFIEGLIRKSNASSELLSDLKLRT